MDAIQFQRLWSRLKPDLRRQWDKITDEDLAHIEGQCDRFLKTATERYGPESDAVCRWTDARLAQYRLNSSLQPTPNKWMGWPGLGLVRAKDNS
jgi:uncharacterized protein YjbJ (UPF0337 family)